MTAVRAAVVPSSSSSARGGGARQRACRPGAATAASPANASPFSCNSAVAAAASPLPAAVSGASSGSVRACGGSAPLHSSKASSASEVCQAPLLSTATDGVLKSQRRSSSGSVVPHSNATHAMACMRNLQGGRGAAGGSKGRGWRLAQWSQRGALASGSGGSTHVSCRLVSGCGMRVCR